MATYTPTRALQPRWQAPEQLPGPVLATVRSWLLDDGSLTQRLLDTGRPFHLERLQQHWEQPTVEERQLLQMGAREQAMVRKIIMSLGGEAAIYARSVFPVRSLEGPLLRLRRLRNQSLGAFLFARPDMCRSPFEVTLLDSDSAYLPAALQQPDPAWARRSCFKVAGKTLLVSEVFLQGFPRGRSLMPLHRSRRGRVSATIAGPVR